MSAAEQQPGNLESLNSPEHTEQSAELEAKKAEHLEDLLEKAEKDMQKQHEQLHEARRATERIPKQEQQLPAPEQSRAFNPASTSDAKKLAYKQSLQRIRASLPSKAAQRFSKVIHQPAVEKISEVGAKTIMRPSLTLGMAMGAFLGGTALYITARRYGFPLSGSEFLIFGIVGGVVGLLMEAILNLYKKAAAKTQ